ITQEFLLVCDCPLTRLLSTALFAPFTRFLADPLGAEESQTCLIRHRRRRSLSVFIRVHPRLLSCLNFTSIRRSAPFFGNWSRIPHPSRPAVPPRGWTTSRIASRRSGAARTCVPTREPTPSPGARDADLRAAASRRNPPAAAPWRPPRSFHPTALRRTRR